MFDEKYLTPQKLPQGEIERLKTISVSAVEVFTNGDALTPARQIVFYASHMEHKKILFIEDTPECQIILQNLLKEYDLMSCGSLAEARSALQQGPYAALLIDIELPDGDGLRFLAELPEAWKKNVAIFIISSKTGLANKAMAFSYGADDFISKPFDPIEVKMRVDAKIRKMQDVVAPSENFQIEDLLINVAEQKLYLQNAGNASNISFTSLEFRIFSYLSKNKNKVITRDEIIQHIWGSDVHVTDRTVDAHIAHIRKKIAESVVKIETVFGTGYKIITPGR